MSPRSSRRCGKYGFRTKDELGIAELPHLRNVETVQLGLRRHAVPDEVLEHHVDGEAQREDDAEQGGDTHQLRSELGCISVEQTRHVAGDAVPASAVVAGAVGKEADRQYAPQSVGAVDRDGAYRVVHLEHALDE